MGLGLIDNHNQSAALGSKTHPLNSIKSSSSPHTDLFRPYHQVIHRTRIFREKVYSIPRSLWGAQCAMGKELRARTLSPLPPASSYPLIFPKIKELTPSLPPQTMLRKARCLPGVRSQGTRHSGLLEVRFRRNNDSPSLYALLSVFLRKFSSILPIPSAVMHSMHSLHPSHLNSRLISACRVCVRRIRRTRDARCTHDSNTLRGYVADNV